ncbi:acyltransferase family protein [Methyloraptor flagellatus]|uniref:Acyltransferase n=1 Tax=Methyloraptor flagellatus TaxID=3162530 RepID=A0AAU7XAJ5_9HYPH
MRYRSIQTLRAVAALTVAAHHADLVAFDRLWFGTDIAFVISGFVVGTIGSAQAGATFFLKRLARIVPLYALVTLLMCAFSLVPGVFATFRFTWPELVRSLSFIPYQDVSGHLWPLFVPGWSLNFEILFYAVFALALTGRRPVIATIVLFAAAVGLGTVFAPATPAGVLLTSPMLLEFCAGLTLALLRHRLVARLGAPAGLAFMAIGAVAIALAPEFPHALVVGEPLWGRALMIGGAAALMVMGALAIESAGRWPGWTRLAEAIGERGYSIYIWNWLTIAAVHKAIGFGYLSDVVALTATLAVAEVSHRYLEYTIYGWLRDRLRALKHSRTARQPPEANAAAERDWRLASLSALPGAGQDPALASSASPLTRRIGDRA